KKHVSGNAFAHGFDRRLNLLGGGAPLPIVGVVENRLKTAGRQGLAQRLGVVAVRHDVFHLADEIVLRLAVQHGDLMARLDQLFYEQAANEEGPPDNQYLHTLLNSSDAPSSSGRGAYSNDTETSRNIPAPDA